MPREIVNQLMEIEGLHRHADLVNGFWEEFEARHQTQIEEHPWKLKYYIALAFAEGVAKGLSHGKTKRD